VTKQQQKINKQVPLEKVVNHFTPEHTSKAGPSWGGGEVTGGGDNFNIRNFIICTLHQI
jgi:hypothetical protein